MKLNVLVQDFKIFVTNEEKKVLSKIDDIMPFESFNEREQTIIENLIRKSLVSKIQRKGSILVMANEL